jgi:hypothetical protein
MNPKYRNLKGSPVVVTDDNGSYEFVCSGSIRGNGSQMCTLTIEGLSTSAPKLQTQYHMEFNGQKTGGEFERILEKSGMFKVRFRTLISDPEFWT